MSLVKDRVLQRSVSTGTGGLLLSEKVASYRKLRARYADGAEGLFSVEHHTDDQFEIFRGTLTWGSPDALSRDLAYRSSGREGRIIGATNASPIVIETEEPHELATGNVVSLHGVLGNTAANGGQRPVTVVDAVHFSLDGTTGNGGYVSGGRFVQHVSLSVGHKNVFAAWPADLISEMPVAGGIPVAGVDGKLDPAWIDVLATLPVGADGLVLTRRVAVDGGLAFELPGGPLIEAEDVAEIMFDLAASSYHAVTIAGDRTLDLANVTVGQRFRLRIEQGTGGNHTVTWWGNIRWPGGLVPALSSIVGRADVVEFLCTADGDYDGWGVAFNLCLPGLLTAEVAAAELLIALAADAVDAIGRIVVVLPEELVIDLAAAVDATRIVAGMVVAEGLIVAVPDVDATGLYLCPTCTVGSPTLCDGFIDVAGTSLLDHDPDIGGPWLADLVMPPPHVIAADGHGAVIGYSQNNAAAVIDSGATDGTICMSLVFGDPSITTELILFSVLFRSHEYLGEGVGGFLFDCWRVQLSNALQNPFPTRFQLVRAEADVTGDVVVDEEPVDLVYGAIYRIVAEFDGPEITATLYSASGAVLATLGTSDAHNGDKTWIGMWSQTNGAPEEKQGKLLQFRADMTNAPVLCPGCGVGSPLVCDSFVDDPDAPLDEHTPNVGGPWIHESHVGDYPLNIAATGVGATRPDDIGTPGGVAVIDGVTADGTICCAFEVRELAGDIDIGILFRAADDATNGYFGNCMAVLLNVGAEMWLYHDYFAAAELLDSTLINELAPGIYRLEVTFAGDSIDCRLYRASGNLLLATLSATDARHSDQTGVGLYLNRGTASHENPTRVLQFRVDSAGSSIGTAEVVPEELVISLAVPAIGGATLTADVLPEELAIDLAADAVNAVGSATGTADVMPEELAIDLAASTVSAVGYATVTADVFPEELAVALAADWVNAFGT